MSTYYDRSKHDVDGFQVFATAEDAKRENELAAMVQEMWGCEFHRFGFMSAIDWYASRNRQMIGLAELKARSFVSSAHDTVWLNVRKWQALTHSSLGLGVPAVFFVRFLDGIRWIPVHLVDATQHRIAGCTRIVKADNDIEPVIDIPIEQMRILAAWAPEAH